MRRVCLNKVHEMAQRDERVLYIGSDPGPGTLNPMKEEFPERFFIEGIAEAHVIGMAAGMAIEGFVPYVNTISTFITRRCYEQIAVDLCMHNLPVRLIGNGGGFVYSPLGPTHQSIEDIAIMRALPNMTVLCVSDAEEMRAMMDETLDWPGPIYIRLGKGGDPVVYSPDDNFKIGKATLKRKAGDVLIVTTGVMVQNCLDAAVALSADGISCGVLHMPTVKPIDVDGLVAAVEGVKLLVSVEEHLLTGGLGSAILETLVDRSDVRLPRVKRLGISDAFAKHYGSQSDQLKHYGIDASGITKSIKTAFAGG
ncbi:MAG: transketolase [Rhodospirillaceae bacterium]|nr:MAG: transketolase [Rhodospirillaceae bacterium]